MRSRNTAGAIVASAALLAMAACSTGAQTTGAPKTEKSPTGTTTAAAPLTETRGPNGEKPTATSDLTLSAADAAKVKAGHYTAALLWHTSSDFTNAVTAGADDEFARLGVKVVATTDAGFDAAKQKSDVETVLAKKPSAVISLPLDPTTAAEAFRPAKQAGTKLVFLSNVPTGYRQGVDYESVVTDDLFQMGKQAADALAKSMGGKGEIGWIYHDAKYYVTNQRDNAFKTTIERDHPGIKIVAKQGIADPARAEDIANAMISQHPDLNGVYVTWAEPAEGVLSALRNAGNTKTKVVTLDLSEPIALDMVSGGNVIGMVADQAYELGRALAADAAYGLLGKKAPPFLVAPALTVTKDNLREGWHQSLHRKPPASVLKAAK
ncbi:substrate-binding domain-containing protein [Wenjunlia tyrosinilytica]|uniref:Sugar ABC transporter substrate-binding protein n=1 Tax=Wenjunlia tyrosinilytica TaxID=1544741 RepID=A0A917ZTK0_9ACTN|nr:substrate-binding domain-containing protein [Wenjunlia tyrosinilytica]GGO94508.1 sugar ABC transporter substrate-binding protein [Wenjunlia tyrosinilytica]